MKAVRNLVQMLFRSKRAKPFTNIFIIGLIIFLVTPAPAHLCHDPFRPQEHLVLVPDEGLIRMEGVGEFRVYIENTFSSTLREVQMFVESPAFDIEIQPSVLTKLVPGERAFFLVKLKLREGFEPGDYSLRISVRARSAELRPSVEEMGVVVEKRVPEQKIEPIPPIKPGETKPEENRLGAQVEEIKASEREYIMPTGEKMVLPEKRSELPVEEIKPSERVVEPQKVGEVVVKVEEIPFWKKPYFYIVFILLLVGILIWRKIK